MRIKKMMAFCLAAVAGMGLLTGCGSNESEAKRYAKCAEVSDYEGVEYVPASREVTQEQIDESIESFCTDNNETTKDYDSAIKDGDDVNLNYVKTINGVEQASNTDEEGANFTIGKDALAPGVDEQLIGLTPGTEKKITITYPDDYSDTTLAGIEAVFDITVNYITITTTPEYTDELVKTATDGEYTTTDAYTKHLTEELQKEADDTVDDTNRANVLKAIKEKTTFVKYPENEVEEYVEGVMAGIESNASQYGIEVGTFLQYFYGYSDEAAFVEFLQSSVESVMQEKIIVYSIALDHDLIADEDDISAYKNKLMEENDVDEEAISQQYSDDDLFFYATEENVLNYLMESAVQVESTEDSSSEDGSEEDASGDETTEATDGDSTEATTEAAE